MKNKAKKATETFHFEEMGGTMGRAEEFRNLGQEMAHEYDARMEFVANVKKETADLMKQIQARQQERNRETAEMMKGFQRENHERAREVKNMLTGFRRENEAAATAWQGVTTTMERKRAGKH